ncbi:MAG: ABC transporter permease [Azoarcus sp.]|jgi:hypothetical protein|nr:ABC transporter permease [Azoarcus sp.]
MGRGVFFNREDERHLSTVIVLSKNIRQNLFGNENAIGRHVLVDNCLVPSPSSSSAN